MTCDSGLTPELSHRATDMDQPASNGTTQPIIPVGSSELVLPQPDEPCPLCEAKGRRIVLTLQYDPQYLEVECCDCKGTGRRPVRQNICLDCPLAAFKDGSTKTTCVPGCRSNASGRMGLHIEKAKAATFPTVGVGPKTAARPRWRKFRGDRFSLKAGVPATSAAWIPGGGAPSVGTDRAKPDIWSFIARLCRVP